MLQLMLREELFTDHVGLHLSKKKTSIVFEPSSIWYLFVVTITITLMNTMR